MEELTPHQFKALDFNHSISLRANAGSGKTFVLAKRYLQIIIEGKVALQKIAAITFTDKAAGELYTRIAKEIDDKIEKSVMPDEISLLKKVRRQLLSANISTIHSFCINILKEFPVEAELDANFTSIDSTTSSELLELSIEETIREKLEDAASEYIKDLIRLFSTKGALVKQLEKMIDKRTIVLRLKNEIYHKGVQQIADFFQEIFVRYFEILFLPQIKLLLTDLKKLNDKVLANDKDNSCALTTARLIKKLETTTNIYDIISTIHLIKDQIFTKSNSIKKQGYLSSKHHTGVEKEINSVKMIFNELLKIEIDDSVKDIEYQLAVTGKFLIDIFNDILSLYNNKKKELGYLDYEDILLKTQKLLQLDDVKKFLSDRFSYLMVDEYQDTNELQYSIFMPILGDLKKGNLFVVGDEKQSIYRFRDAELEIFDRTDMDIVESGDAKSLMTLPDSFRMEPEICLFTNVLFRSLFSNPNSIYNEVEHSDIICAKPTLTGGRVSILIADEESELTEADLVCRQVLTLMKEEQENLDWKDIAILVRKRSSFAELEKQFLKYGIPNKLIGGTGFYQRQSIYDVYNYFSFLLNTYNDAALIGILRSPFFSISDVKIFELSLKFGSSYWEKLQNSNSNDEELKIAVNQLKENLRLAGQKDINSIMRKIFKETNFIAVLASRSDAVQELANIEKLLKITNTFTNQGFKTLYDYVDYLKNSISNLEDEAQAGLVEQLNAVNILTLHQAKGLEFPVVFLYHSHEESNVDMVRAKSLSIDKIFGLLTKVPINNSYFEEYNSAPVIVVRDYVERKKNLAEIKRLLYVGITRAEKYLFISASPKGKNKFPPTSFISLIFDGLNVGNSAENISLVDDLTFLTKENNHYKNVKMQLSVNIPIIRYIDLKEIVEHKSEKVIQSKDFLLDNISDTSKGEIISATKISTYAQCPLKYNFIYNYGYSKLFANLKEYDNRNTYSKYGYDGFDGEDTLSVEFDESPTLREHSDIKGKIIHKALQKEIEIESLEEFINTELDIAYINLFDSKKTVQKFVKDLVDTFTKFYSSNEYGYLRKFDGYRNEMEIYLKEEDHYLFGIIDKIIVGEGKIIIVDYKTDFVDINNLKAKAEYYLNQLKFYVYIASKLYKDFDSFEIRIVFLMFPDHPYVVSYDGNKVGEVREEILFLINGILRAEYPKNLSHCNECNFSINNECVV